MAPHRPGRSPALAIVHDRPHGRRHGHPDSPDLPGPVQDCNGHRVGRGRGGNALHLPGGLHCWIPGHCVGVPDRDPSPAAPSARIIRLDGVQLDLQLHDRADYARRDREHRVPDLYHFCRFKW